LPEGRTSQFLAYEHGVLAGFLSLQDGDEIEIYLMVHPAYRRRGIGGTLLAAARDEGRARGQASMLLVCDEASRSGRAFAEAVGANYHNSEYEMELDADRVATPPPNPRLHVGRAGSDDLATLGRLGAAAFGGSADARQQRFAGQIERPDYRFYIARLDGEPVGSLRVANEDRRVYITAFGVLPEHQGRGYGRRLLATTITSLLADNWRPIFLEVATDNRHALSLYRACGFRETRAYGYYRLTLPPPMTTSPPPMPAS
jgi:ribosomal protein S18 acetylase RimI-like enzyme